MSTAPRRASGPSFPSGHVTGSTLFYGFIFILLFAHLHSVHSVASRTLVALAALFVVAAVALSRIYLGAHYLSDVLGSFAVAIAWLALSLSCIHGSLNALVFSRAAASKAGPDGASNKETKNDRRGAAPRQSALDEAFPWHARAGAGRGADDRARQTCGMRRFRRRRCNLHGDDVKRARQLGKVFSARR